MLGSSVFDGVEFRVEWFLGELTEIFLPLIILIIKSMWVSCVVRTWRDHILRGVYLVSHRWIWDLGIICSWIQLFLEDKQYFDREDCNVPILGHYNITECYAYQSSQIRVRESSGECYASRGFIGPDLHRSSSGSILHGLALVPLHSDDFRNFELLWVIS